MRAQRDLTKAEFLAALERNGMKFRAGPLGGFVSGGGLAGSLVIDDRADRAGRRALLAHILRIAAHDAAREVEAVRKRREAARLVGLSRGLAADVDDAGKVRSARVLPCDLSHTVL